MVSAPRRRLGPYEILAPLGAGGMGEVYRARDTRVGREVAVKILPREFATDPRRLRRFEQEARLAASLNHPNIVGLFDVGPDHDPPYLVSELVPGVSLRAVMHRGAIPVRKVLDLAAQLAEGLAAAHGAGVVHRDIKPENVMVTPEGRVKILDFGLAREDGVRPGVPLGASAARTETVTMAPEPERVTSPGMVVGTVSYMSPEQASGQTVDFRSDQFSFGLVLYEMLARRRAFERDSAAQTMAAIIQDEPSPLPETVPTQVRWVLERCLSKDPPLRYASTLDLARELRQLGDHSSELTTASGALVVAPQRRRPRQLRAMAAGAVSLVLVSLAVGRLSLDDPHADLTGYKLTPFATQLPSSNWPSWSPDGKSVAFVGRAEGEAQAQVWIQRLDAPTPIQITRPPLGVLKSLSWTPDSRMIYCLARSGRTPAGLFRVPVGGGEPSLVQGDVSWYALSPDGKSVMLSGPTETPGRAPAIRHASPPDAPPRPYEPAPAVGQWLDSETMAAFAPDGSKVCLAHGGTRGGGAWLLPWPRGTPRRAFEGMSLGGGFCWLPDSRRLVAASASDPSQPTRLMMVDTRTDRRWPILVSNAYPVLPSVSPDGARIAFVSRLDHGDVVEIPLTGGTPRTILGSSRSEEMPALSSDGKELVYVGDPRGPSEVWSKNMEDGELRRLLAPSDLPAEAGTVVGSPSDPELSRDRRRLAVALDLAGKGPRLFTAFTAGGTPIRATTEENCRESSPTWSPDGDRLAYVLSGGVGSEHPGMHLAVIRVGSSGRPALVLDSLRNEPPAWSPTGEWIAAAAGARDRIVLVSPDGRTRREVGSSGGPFAWSPDGRTLYRISPWSQRASLVAIDAGTGAERVVRPLGDLIGDLSSTGRLSLTPDGTALVCSIKRARFEIWTLEGVKPPAPWYTRLWSK